MKKVVFCGAGGHAKSVLDSINKNIYEIVGFCEKEGEKSFCGFDVLGTDDCLEQLYKSGIKNAFVSVGSVGKVNVRKNVFNLLKQLKFNLINVVDKSAIVATKNIGEGNFFGKKSLVNVGSTIGNMCIINSGSIIEHDCKIGDFVHVAPGAVLCGNVKVGNNSHIGAGSVVRQGIDIGENVIVGAGSVVVSNLPNNVVAFGNPCKVRGKNE